MHGLDEFTNVGVSVGAMVTEGAGVSVETLVIVGSREGVVEGVTVATGVVVPHADKIKTAIAENLNGRIFLIFTFLLD